jgi:hypothetical protein
VITRTFVIPESRSNFFAKSSVKIFRF